MAPQTVGTNCLTQAEDALIELLASSTACQTFLGVATKADAKLRIYCHEVPIPSDNRDQFTPQEFAALFPCIMVMPPTNGSMLSLSLSAIGGEYEYDADVRFTVRFERFVSADSDDQEIIRELLNAVVDVVEDIKNLATDPGALAFTSLEIASPPRREAYDDMVTLGDRQWIDLQIAKEVGGRSQ